jgi:hypothetical protein
VTVVGRFEGKPPERVKLNGRVRGETQALDVDVSAGAEAAGLARACGRG